MADLEVMVLSLQLALLVIENLPAYYREYLLDVDVLLRTRFDEL